MSIEAIVTILLTVALLLVAVLGGYFYLRDKTLNDIRADVYRLFLFAEHDPRFKELPRERMMWVLKHARIMLPGWAQFLITDAFLEKIVEGWFRAIKDLLDDGKLNKSTTEGE